MNTVNQFEISAILHSEIVGKAKIGHGQIGSLGGAQQYLNLVHVEKSPALRYGRRRADETLIEKAFHAVRNVRGDHGSPDLYVADPERNAEFIAKCRELGLAESAYTINKTLFYMRKNSRLKNLDSKRTSIDYDEYAFASEFAATELKYEIGVTIDDIICDPDLAARFDSIAQRVTSGFSSLEYRWAILSIRKSGRQAEWKPGYKMPRMTAEFNLIADAIQKIPDTFGVYLLSEKTKPLYVRATEHLRHEIELHRRPDTLAAISSDYWQPEPKAFVVSYATLSDKKLLRPVEHRLIEESRPIFNVPRKAA
jgi:site-specific DNA-methyltransferase (adenine-specific)